MPTSTLNTPLTFATRECRAARKPYIASMGIYLCKASAMHHLLTERFTTQNDFGSDIIPGAKDLGMHVQAHLFKGYWEDIGTIRAFYESNLGLTDSPNPNFSFYDKDAPIYTMSRFLPPCKVLSAGALGEKWCWVE